MFSFDHPPTIIDAALITFLAGLMLVGVLGVIGSSVLALIRAFGGGQ